MSAGAGRYLAIVPARGGSKRIPRKNIRSFHGLPLLARTISTLLDSSLFDSVLVSTDDFEIAGVADQYGAQVPFMRPERLSGDATPTASVIRHALDQVEADLGEFDAVCCAYPGAVLMRREDYLKSSRLVGKATQHDAVVAAVVRFSHPIQRALEQRPDGLLQPAFPAEILDTQTQDVAPTWHDAGQFYWASPRRWRTSIPLLSSVLPYEVPSWRVQDIDTEEDWVRAEIVHALLAAEGFREESN